MKNNTVWLIGLTGLIPILVLALLVPAESSTMPPTPAFSKIIHSYGSTMATKYNDVFYMDYAYAQISDSTIQACIANGQAVNVTLNTNDSIYKMTHSISSNTHQITTQENGIYQIIAGAQVGEAVNQADGIFNMWMVLNASPVDNSNVKVHIERPTTHTETIVTVLNWIGYLESGDIVSFGMACTDPNIGIIATATTAVEPATPSIIISITKIS